MADLATLGIAVDSSQAEKGAVSLQKLSGAARMAEAATKGVTTGARGAASAAAAISGPSSAAASALQKEANAARQAAQALDAHNRAANQNIRGGAKGNAANIAAQFQDIAVSAQMGMGPMQIALQQGTQLAAVLAAMENPAKGIGEALKSVISPVSLLTIGLIGLVAAGLQMVDWPAAAAYALDAMAGALEAIAPYAVAAAAALALIYAPSIIVGLVELIAMISRVGLAATVAGAQMASAWIVASGPIGWLIAGIAAVGTAAYLLRDQISAAIGVDVVAVFKAAGNFIINSFEAAFSDVEFIWSNFGDMMGAAVIGGVNIAIRAIDDLIQRATQGIDRILEYINPLLEGAGMSGISPVSGSFKLDQIDNPYADRFSRANAAHAGEIERIMGQDRLGQFGAAIADGASWASDKLREMAGWMGTAEEATKKAGKAAKDGADGWRVFGREAQRAAEETIRFAQDIASGFMSDLRSGLEQGKGLWHSFADAAINALSRIMDKLMQMATDQLVTNLLGSLFGGAFLSPRAFGAIQAGGGGLYADGGYTGAGGKYEPAGTVHKGEYVFSAAAVRALGVVNLDKAHRRARGYAEGGYVDGGIARALPTANANQQPMDMHITIGWSRSADGNLKPFVEEAAYGVSQKVTARGIKAYDEGKNRQKLTAG